MTVLYLPWLSRQWWRSGGGRQGTGTTRACVHLRQCYENFILAYDTYNQTNNIPQKNLTDESNDQSKAEYQNNLETLELEYGHEIKLLSLNQVSPKIHYMLMFRLTKDFINGTDTTIYTEYYISMKDKLWFWFFYWDTKVFTKIYDEENIYKP